MSMSWENLIHDDWERENFLNSVNILFMYSIQHFIEVHATLLYGEARNTQIINGKARNNKCKKIHKTVK